jgi:hypothetical protein
MSDVAQETFMKYLMLGIVCLTACDDGDGAGAPLGDNDVRSVSARLSLCFKAPLGLHFEEAEANQLVSGSVATYFNRRNTCILAAADCMGVAACLGYSELPCDGEERCEGSVQVGCSRHPITQEMVRTTEDCADDPHGNSECVTEFGSPWCAAPAALCEGRENLSCEGDTLVECFDQPRIRHCDRIGRRCEPGVDSCLRADFMAPCTPCQGDVAYVCDFGDLPGRSLDCGALGMRCEPTEVYDEDTDSSIMVGECVAREAACERSSCDGASATLCLNGQPFAFECPFGSQCAVVFDAPLCTTEPVNR